MLKVVALSARELQILNGLLDQVEPCQTKTDATYGEYGRLREQLSPELHDGKTQLVISALEAYRPHAIAYSPADQLEDLIRELAQSVAINA